MLTKSSQLLRQASKINSNLYNVQKMAFSQSVHFRVPKEQKEQEMQSLESSKTYSFPHPIWSKDEVENCPITIKDRLTFGDHCAYYFINSLRLGFDVLSGYKPIFPWQNKEVTENIWINRLLFLETVAGVPGFVGAMIRHLRSLRQMKRDQGWIHTLLEEAENERVHLITFLNVKEPSKLFRFGVIAAQFWYVGLFFGIYVTMPRVAHRAVGYLEEQAVITYTHLIEEIRREGSPVEKWQTQAAPKLAAEYWNLGPDATMEDVILSIRKDEEHHKEVNHSLADDYTQNKPNPFPPGY